MTREFIPELADTLRSTYEQAQSGNTPSSLNRWLSLTQAAELKDAGEVSDNPEQDRLALRLVRMELGIEDIRTRMTIRQHERYVVSGRGPNVIQGIAGAPVVPTPGFDAAGEIEAIEQAVSRAEMVEPESINVEAHNKLLDLLAARLDMVIAPILESEIKSRELQLRIEAARVFPNMVR